MSLIRPSALVGVFYPREPQAVLAELRDFFDQADTDRLEPGFPKAVIAPHAGFAYSGPIAARAHDLLKPARGIVSRVIMLCPCHRVPVRGMALPGTVAFDTPLGRVPVDLGSVMKLQGFPGVVEMPEAHRLEHAIEVQLPFLQHVLGAFTLLPVVVGNAAPEQVASLLDLLWGGEETLIVISSDLSHYQTYAAASAMDAKTAEAIAAFDPTITHEQACGATPIAGALLAARARGLVCEVLDVRNSGDTAGGKGKVVGYGAFSLSPPKQSYGNDHGLALLRLARASIQAAVHGSVAPMQADAPAWLREHRATFVTLKCNGRLRGCIGLLEAARPLGQDVVANVRAAGLQDPRFAALKPEELPGLEIEISLLSRPTRVSFDEPADLIKQITPGLDGLILEADSPQGSRRSTFLPQVWEDIPSPEQFIEQLKLKAGLAPGTRTQRCSFKRYRVTKWREADFRSGA